MSRFVVRPMEEADLNKGFIALLSQLTTTGEPSYETVQQRFLELQSNKDFAIRIVEDTREAKIVGSATLFVERKFIHDCGKVGHIEDVVVDQSCRGEGLGRCIIEQLINMARDQGCYKVMLDCSEHNVAFYEKCGMRRNVCNMVKYFDEDC